MVPDRPSSARNDIMQMPKSWKVTTAGAAAAGLGAFGLGLGLSSTESDAGARPDAITLQERIRAGDAADPGPSPEAGAADTSQLSPDGESFDSPLQSPDDSPDGGESLDSPEPSVAPAPAAVSAPAPAPARIDAPASVDSPDGGSVASVDSPD